MPQPHRPLDALSRPVRRLRRAVLRRRRALAAVLTGVAVYAGLATAVASPPPTVPVLVAARDLPAGQLLDDGDLTTAGFSPGTEPAHVSDVAVGRVLAAPLRRGEPVTDVRLVGPSLTTGHPQLTAVPVRLPDAGMVGLLEVGDRIDLVAADPQGGGAELVAGGVPVLAIPALEVDPTGGSALPGRLVVVGAEPADVTGLADAMVRSFVTYTWAN